MPAADGAKGRTERTPLRPSSLLPENSGPQVDCPALDAWLTATRVDSTGYRCPHPRPRREWNLPNPIVVHPPPAKISSHTHLPIAATYVLNENYKREEEEDQRIGERSACATFWPLCACRASPVRLRVTRGCNMRSRRGIAAAEIPALEDRGAAAGRLRTLRVRKEIRGGDWSSGAVNQVWGALLESRGNAARLLLNFKIVLRTY